MVYLQMFCRLNFSYSLNLNHLIHVLGINVNQGVVNVQDTIFAWVGQVIAQLWHFDFARMWSGIDFQKLNSMDFIVIWLKLFCFSYLCLCLGHDRVWGYFCHLQCQFYFYTKNIANSRKNKENRKKCTFQLYVSLFQI